MPTNGVLAIFQFQNGTIKSHLEVCYYDYNDDFNSKMVRLRAIYKNAPLTKNQISIPKWYD